MRAAIPPALRRAARARLAAALAVLVIAASGCGKPPQPQHGEMVVNVVGAESRRQPVADELSVIGSLAANEAVELTSLLDGTIEAIVFEEGQPVRAGELLIQVRDATLRTALDEARAALRLASTREERYRSLVEDGAVSQLEYDEAVAAYESALAVAARTTEALRDAAITAPFDGVMGRRLVSVGQFVSKGDALASVADLDPMKAEFRVPERYLNRLAIDQAVEFSVAAHPDELFAGTVFFIDPQVDESTRTVLVKAAVPNPDGRLLRGMFTDLRLIAGVREQAVVVPESAIILNGEAVSVFVVQPDQTAHPRPVTTGVRLPGLVEITDGLQAGETVVTEGTQKLRPGAKVQLRLAEPPSLPR